MPWPPLVCSFPCSGLEWQPSGGLAGIPSSWNNCKLGSGKQVIPNKQELFLSRMYFTNGEVSKALRLPYFHAVLFCVFHPLVFLMHKSNIIKVSAAVLPSTLYCVPNHLSFRWHWPSLAADSKTRFALWGLSWLRASAMIYKFKTRFQFKCSFGSAWPNKDS